jgi:hypothetical protein
MTRYEKIKSLSIDDMAWFILAILEDAEQGMLSKLEEYGLEVSMVTLEPELRKTKIVASLMVEENDGTDT